MALLSINNSTLHTCNKKLRKQAAKKEEHHHVSEGVIEEGLAQRMLQGILNWLRSLGQVSEEQHLVFFNGIDSFVISKYFGEVKTDSIFIFLHGDSLI